MEHLPPIWIHIHPVPWQVATPPGGGLVVDRGQLVEFTPLCFGKHVPHPSSYSVGRQVVSADR